MMQPSPAETDGVGRTVLYNSEDVVEMHHQPANERV